MLVALVAVVLFAGTWFTVIGPKMAGDDAAPATPAPAAKAPGQQGLENAVGNAKGAVDQANGAAKATEAAVNDPATPAAKAPAKASTDATAKAPAKAAAAPKAQTATGEADPSARFLAELDKGKTVVLLFWNPEGIEDRFAFKSVHRANMADDDVEAQSVRISEVGKYEAITTGVQVLTAPTVVVIGPDKKAVARTGYVERKTVEQLIADSRKSGR